MECGNENGRVNSLALTASEAARNGEMAYTKCSPWRHLAANRNRSEEAS